jgi:hypothetical protein
MTTIVKFPYSACRRVISRRRSKNGTPEERAAKAAQEITNPPADIAFIGNAKPDLWSESGVILSKLNVKGLLPEAVKCLGVFLQRSNVAAALARQRRASSKSSPTSADEIRGALAGLDEMDRVYISGYMQGIIDARALR